LGSFSWKLILLARIAKFEVNRSRTFSAAFLRIGFSAIMIIFYLVNATRREFFWGPHGQLRWATYITQHNLSLLSLFRYSGSSVFADGLFILSLLVAVAFMLGIVPRISSWAFLLTTFAMFDRNRFMEDGGDHLLVTLTVYLCLADTSCFFALIPARGAIRNRWSQRTMRAFTLVHNAAMFLISAQVALVYFWASFYKISGSTWRDGSALFYILSSDRYTLPVVANLLLSHPVILSALAYGTVLFQMAFAILMWNRRIKLPLVMLMLVLHIGIAVVLGLVMFSLIMIVADLALLYDDDWIRLRRISYALAVRIRLLLRGKSRLEA
jgi:hypothetical protein